MYWLTHCHRGQAPSHICIAFHMGNLDLSHRGCRTGLAIGVEPCNVAYRYARIRRLVRLAGCLLRFSGR
ncbi:hypothetical protein DYL61_08950 [Pseudomonas nabeulensis]|uniref:Uncharacterized protein n=1 Tax=Pseudomonas nabeulensis TaxID=2293833 RepID=A0A4Z0B6L1_9PSED|nr:hypothetical protein DYL61_08950 [Pseudomonas nabeulensis]